MHNAGVLWLLLCCTIASESPESNRKSSYRRLSREWSKTTNKLSHSLPHCGSCRTPLRREDRRPNPATATSEDNSLIWAARCSRNGLSLVILVLTLVLIARVCAAQSNDPPVRQALTADQIVSEMVSRNKLRAAALPDYTTRQICKLEYRGFPSERSGEMILDVHYTAGGKKDYALVSESGSKLIINRVLKRLLESEEESQSAKNRRETALTPDNYTFSLIGEKSIRQGRYYILGAEPKIRNKFVFRGQVWVDESDFAVARIVASPAKNPSFWITDTQIEQQYEKFGSFWLPVQNQSTSKIRVVGGTATLLIQYKNYSLGINVKQGTRGQTATTQ